jgi:hypothetical protein
LTQEAAPSAYFALRRGGARLACLNELWSAYRPTTEVARSSSRDAVLGADGEVPIEFEIEGDQ